MIRVFIHNHHERTASARRDGEQAVVEITDRVLNASWSLTLRDPYETARVNTSIRINELGVLGLGTPRRGADLPALHASGWLEIRDDEHVRVFFGVINRLSTGLSVDSHGARRSQGVSLSAVSWLSIVARPFRLTEASQLISAGGLLDFGRWSDIFERVFAEGASRDVAEGLRSAWSFLVPFLTPDEKLISEYRVLIDPEDLGGIPRSLTRVKGANLSQVPTSTSGSLWATFVQTFAPAPQLIELFPAREAGEPVLIYRLKPLPPHVDEDYFDIRDQVTEDVAHSTINAHRAPAYQEISNILSYSLDYRGERNNYIEVTSSYLGVSPLVGLNSDPYALTGDISRYGLHPVEIPYSLIRLNGGELRRELEELTRYATALYSEGHAFAYASIETTYSPATRVGEWARWYDYVEGEGSVMVGYVTSVSHRVDVDQNGRVTRRTSIMLERVSQFGRPSAKQLAQTWRVVAYTSDDTIEGE